MNNTPGEYEYVFQPSQLQTSRKKFDDWVKKAKTMKDWRPKKRVRKFMSERYGSHLFQSEEEIKRKGYDWILDEMDGPDQEVI